MRTVILAVILIVCLAFVFSAASDEKTQTPKWSFNGTVIEACSCPMFCQCFFAGEPAAHHHNGQEEHFCLGNLAYKVNKGNYGDTSLAGAKFFMSGNLGPDFAKGQGDWNVITFDKSVTSQQREGIMAILQRIYPLHWNSFTTAEGVVDQWQVTKDGAVALLDNGKSAEVRLNRFPGMTNEPVIINNLRYVGAPRNNGFMLMPNTVEAYRVGPKAFEFKNTNGFVVTIDANSEDYKGM